MHVTIETIPDAVIVRSPYNPTFPTRARELGGKWSASDKAWTFSPRDEDRVRDLCADIYGDDGRGWPDLVTVRVDLWALDETNNGYGAHIYAFGRELASRSGRDSRVKLGADVVLVDGSFPSSGGSRKYPKVDADNATVEVRNVPRRAALDLISKLPDHVSIDEPSDARLTALRDERDRLLARLKELRSDRNRILDRIAIIDEEIGE